MRTDAISLVASARSATGKLIKSPKHHIQVFTPLQLEPMCVSNANILGVSSAYTPRDTVDSSSGGGGVTIGMPNYDITLNVEAAALWTQVEECRLRVRNTITGQEMEVPATIKVCLSVFCLYSCT